MSKMTDKENIKQKIKAIYPHIVVGGDIDKPCYTIHWYDIEQKTMICGFSSYKLELVRKWLEEEFEVVERDIDDLLNRQQKQLDNYSHNVRNMAKDFIEQQKIIYQQQAEIEDYRRNIKQLTETFTGGNGLRIRVDDMIVYADDLEEWLEFCDKQKAEAIKEYKEKLKEHAYLDSGITGFQEMVVDLSDIENIAEEMVGADNGK